MTKDLALLVGPDQPWLTTEEFLAALDANLRRQARLTRPGRGRPPRAGGARRQTSRPAPADGDTSKVRGDSQPASAKASATAARTAVTRSCGTSATAEPPNPPPVIRAPRAPASTADATAVSSSAQLTS